MGFDHNVFTWFCPYPIQIGGTQCKSCIFFKEHFEMKHLKIYLE